MKFEILKAVGEQDVIGIGLFEGFGGGDFAVLPEALRRIAEASASREEFKAKKGKKLTIPFVEGKTRYAVLCGLGKKEDVTDDERRAAAFDVVRLAASKRLKSVSLALPGADDRFVSRAIAEGARLACYNFDKYLPRGDDERMESPDIVGVLGGDERGLGEGSVIGARQCAARDIINEPGNVINPATFEERARRIAAEVKLEVSAIQADELALKGMNALLSVGKGSAVSPRLIHVTYTPKGSPVATIAIVGKGLTFDSGGLNIKTGDFMRTMKGDKSGACITLAAAAAIAELGLPIKAHAIMPMAENMPDGGSYRPDDIIYAYNGKTIEVDNTDAEGRLALADALAYACEQKPDVIVDVATLTGACCVALGGNTGGLFSNNDKYAEQFLGASKRSGERFWRLPIDDEFLRDKIKSKIAAVVNSGGRYGGAITAAMFLEHFVKEGTPWMHLDIAPVDILSEPRSYYTFGATAFSLRTILSWLIDLSEK
ncbi:putative cytosol aminopeptidase [Synergistales bacterium]|nr:putative cytosol aminopeptidase [Synergistales bacterium]